MGVTSLLLSLALVAPAPAGAAQAPRKQRELPGELVNLTTRDGWTLAAKYLPAKDDKLTFVLLHDARGRHQDWYFLARAMARAGLGYVAVDMRGHGLSNKTPDGQTAHYRQFIVTKDSNEWDNMREDAVAGVEFLKEKGVPENRIALGGSDVGGSVALKYAAVHEEVPFVFWLSPGMSYYEVLTVNAIRAYKARPILMVLADDDPRSTRETAILHQFAQRAAGVDNVALLRVPIRHGTRMLAANKGLVADIIHWIENPSGGNLTLSSSTSAAKAGGATPPSEEELDRLLGEPNAAQ